MCFPTTQSFLPKRCRHVTGSSLKILAMPRTYDFQFLPAWLQVTEASGPRHIANLHHPVRRDRSQGHLGDGMNGMIFILQDGLLLNAAWQVISALKFWIQRDFLEQGCHPH